MRGGMMYGYGFDPLTGTGGAGYTAVNTSAPFSSATGAEIPDDASIRGWEYYDTEPGTMGVFLPVKE